VKQSDISICIEKLSAELGTRVSTASAVRNQHGRDYSRLPSADPDAVVFAESEEDVCRVLAICNESNVPVIAHGASSSLEGHTLAIRGGVAVNVSRMDKILAVGAEDFDVTVQPGVTRKQLNRHLRDTGLFFPIDPGADATIGGMAATRASGTNAVRYGTMRENVIASHFALADGTVIKTGSRARKSSTGYDLTRLFVGSEGTLGIFTELTLRLYPIPDYICAMACPFESVAGAIDTVVEAMQCGLQIGRVEFMDALAIQMANRHSGLALDVAPTLFVEFSGASQIVEDEAQLFGQIASSHGAIRTEWSQDADVRNRLWQARHESLHATSTWKPGAEVWRTDVCVPISKLAESICDAIADIEGSSIEGKILGHVGDGNYHVAYLVDPDTPTQQMEAAQLTERLNRRAVSAGGTVSGEQGVGIAKLHYLLDEHGSAALDAMHRIKLALDPRSIMNPGKIGSDPSNFKG
jgi:D-lactate dehydrogenase (cytochrome)